MITVHGLDTIGPGKSRILRNSGHVSDNDGTGRSSLVIKEAYSTNNNPEAYYGGFRTMCRKLSLTNVRMVAASLLRKPYKMRLTVCCSLALY